MDQKKADLKRQDAQYKDLKTQLKASKDALAKIHKPSKESSPNGSTDFNQDRQEDLGGEGSEDYSDDEEEEFVEPEEAGEYDEDGEEEDEAEEVEEVEEEQDNGQEEEQDQSMPE